MDVRIYLLDELKKLLSFLAHIVDVFLADAAEFITYESLSDDIIGGFVSIIFHSFVESVSSEESTN